MLQKVGSSETIRTVATSAFVISIVVASAALDCFVLVEAVSVVLGFFSGIVIGEFYFAVDLQTKAESQSARAGLGNGDGRGAARCYRRRPCGDRRRARAYGTRSRARTRVAQDVGAFRRSRHDGARQRGRRSRLHFIEFGIGQSVSLSSSRGVSHYCSLR